MELDIFLPNERLAFEYQGELHFHDRYTQGASWQQKKRDIIKREACIEHGINLIEIPYWWDQQVPSLVATIRQFGVNLIYNQDGESIPMQPLQETVGTVLRTQIRW
jgi:hypothetical protein